MNGVCAFSLIHRHVRFLQKSDRSNGRGLGTTHYWSPPWVRKLGSWRGAARGGGWRPPPGCWWHEGMTRGLGSCSLSRWHGVGVQVQEEAGSPSLWHPEQRTLRGMAFAESSVRGENAAQICPQRAEDFNATGWAWGEGGWSSRGLESCVTGGLHRLPGGDVHSVPACVAGPRREERGGGIALPARSEARRWPGSQPGLWGWREGPGLGGI